MPDTAGLGELWIRASRLKERCWISLSVVGSPPGWRVRITPYSDANLHAEGHGEHVINALAQAIDRAEAMGLEPPPADMGHAHTASVGH